jgi:hypothetical protein
MDQPIFYQPIQLRGYKQGSLGALNVLEQLIQSFLNLRQVFKDGQNHVLQETIIWTVKKGKDTKKLPY